MRDTASRPSDSNDSVDAPAQAISEDVFGPVEPVRVELPQINDYSRRLTRDPAFSDISRYIKSVSNVIDDDPDDGPTPSEQGVAHVSDYPPLICHKRIPLARYPAYADLSPFVNVDDRANAHDVYEADAGGLPHSTYLQPKFRRKRRRQSGTFTAHLDQIWDSMNVADDGEPGGHDDRIERRKSLMISKLITKARTMDLTMKSVRGRLPNCRPSKNYPWRKIEIHTIRQWSKYTEVLHIVCMIICPPISFGDDWKLLPRVSLTINILKRSSKYANALGRRNHTRQGK